MINDANFSSSFATWKAHDRNLRASFFNAPFILDVDSRSYVKGLIMNGWLVRFLPVAKSILILPRTLVPFVITRLKSILISLATIFLIILLLDIASMISTRLIPFTMVDNRRSVSGAASLDTGLILACH